MKRMMVLSIILIIAIIGCSARDIELWNESGRRLEERGVECYRRYNGTFYCEDRDGNPYP